MPRHKHADLIHAYADGAEVQYKTREGYWEDIENPSWIPLLEYRIKSRIVKKEGWVNIVKAETPFGVKHPFVVSTIHASKKDAETLDVGGHVATVKIEWEETE